MSLFSRLLLLAAVVPFALANSSTGNTGNSKSCASSDFYFNQADCCVPTGGQKNPPSPPTGTQCPNNGWDWHSGKSCCVPHQPSPPAPTCNKGWNWNSSSLKCTPAPTPTPTPTPPAPSKPSTPSGGDNNCKSFEFYFGRKQCCLPRGGQPSPPSPPSGTQCPPSGWSWHSGKGCCVPHNPPDNQPPPQCNNGWDWDDNDLKCCPHSNPTPPSNPLKPSGKPYSHKRALKARTVNLCPKGLEACPIPGLSGPSGDIECLDTDVELTSCGGCASTGAGQDCTALEGVWNVGCYHGSCQVYTCAQGYRRSLDGHSCIMLD